jgi:type IX secretion system PorP/SprF family membrane protein
MVFLGNIVFSQSIFIGNTYTENMYSLNPPYAGLTSRPSFFISYRKIASEISGAPESISFGGSAMIYRNMSLGTRLYKQSEGLFNTFIGFADYSYFLKLNNSQNLRFGISAGLNSNKINYSDIIADDPSAVIGVASNSFEGTYFESSAGIAYQWKNLEVGVALPKLFNSRNNFGLSVNSFIQYTYRGVSKEIDLKPSLFVSYNNSAPYLCDINIKAFWKQKIWVGAGYRNRPSIIISAGVYLGNLGIGYASELGLEKYANMFNQIHEVTLSYSINKKEKVPIDTLIKPNDDYLALKDTSFSSTSYIDPVFLEENHDSTDVEDLFIEDDESANEISETEGGVYLIKPLTQDTVPVVANLGIREPEKISEGDSIFTLDMVNQLKKDNESFDYEMIEVGDGIYTLKYTLPDSSNLEHNLDEAMLDSLINECDLFEKALKEEEESKKNQANDYTEYYTLQLMINESNKKLLTNPEIVDMARIEETSDGKIKYYYGYFGSKQEAESYQKRLSKFDLETKVLKFEVDE